MTTGLAQFRIIIQEGDRISVRYRPPRREGDELEYASRPLSIDATRRRTIEMQVRLLRNNQLRERRDLECLGENLFAALFYTSDGQGYNDFGRALRDAIRETERGDDGQDDTILRVALQFDDPNSAYASWPWEYMFCPLRERESFGDFFLAHRTKVVLTRFLALTDVEPNLEQPPLRVLLVAPSPTAAEGELLPVESTAVREDLEALGGRGTPTDGSDGGRRRIELRVLPEGDEGVVLFDDFKAALAEFNPHVVHFLGHGEYRDSGGETKGHLAFTRSDGSIDWIEDRVFAEAVGDQKSLRLVFLQACESAETGPSSWYQVVAGTAQRVSQKNIPAVVALHYRVENRIGNAMARAFHAELAQRHSVEAALTAARRVAMSSRHDPGLFTSFGLPVLYLRGVGDVLDPNERPTLSTPPPVRPVEQQRTAKCPFDGAPYNPEEQNFCGRCLQRVVCGKCLRPRTDTESPICLNCGAPWPAAEQRQENAFQAASQPLVSLGGSSGGLPKQKDMHLP